MWSICAAGQYGASVTRSKIMIDTSPNSDRGFGDSPLNPIVEPPQSCRFATTIPGQPVIPRRPVSGLRMWLSVIVTNVPTVSCS